MDLIDHPDSINQSRRVQVREIETLYWIVEDSLYDNKIERARGIFELIACVAKHNKSIMKLGLKKAQIERLKQLSYELYDKQAYALRKNAEIKWPMQPKTLPFKKEHEMESYLVNHPEILQKALSQDDIRIVGRQIKTDFDYACDIVAENSEWFYPIELKIGQSTHGAVSQIEKYCFYFYRTLRYDKYKKIQGILIANGFDAYSINALRKSGIRIFDIVPVDRKNISLREVS